MDVPHREYPSVPHREYPRLPELYASVDAFETGCLFRKKANRIKYWPEVRKRLLEIGVKL
jgi:hypothetical protein